jgi:hypothetical protein
MRIRSDPLVPELMKGSRIHAQTLPIPDISTFGLDSKYIDPPRDPHNIPS